LYSCRNVRRSLLTCMKKKLAEGRGRKKEKIDNGMTYIIDEGEESNFQKKKKNLKRKGSLKGGLRGSKQKKKV